ncbi:SprT family protein [Gorillibacterium sp. CAU 1737]|uniref:SprT family protein n=1 Tax=Gorillibacterium sp. CAU 1737 TaxID=3140362 RepID=UPI003260665B
MSQSSEQQSSCLTDEQLQERIETISLASFGKPFRHKARFNSRLRTTGGRYFTKSHDIEISSRHVAAFGLEELDGIIKHELCHYHLHLGKRGYRHRDADFKTLLKAVGGTRYCSSLPKARKPEPYRYRLSCAACGMEYLRKRRVDPTRYRCGRCRGRLRLEALDLPRPPC